MAYQKPGVEITQVQQSFSPTLISPDLVACIVGAAFDVIPAEGTGSYSYAKVTNWAISNTITLSGMGSNYLDADSVYIDIVAADGSRVHLSKAENSANITASDGGASITISGLSISTAYNNGNVYIGYRALRPQASAAFKVLESLEDITINYGTPVYDNPLGFALGLAHQNAPTAQITSEAISVDYASQVTASGITHTNALDDLQSKEIYALAVLSEDDDVRTALKAHVQAMSTATEKHERIALFSPSMTYTANKATDATTLQAQAAGVVEKRMFYIRPNIGYYHIGSVPVQKLSPKYIQNMFLKGDSSIYAQLASKTTVTVSGVQTTFSAGTDITSSVYTTLAAATDVYKFDALIPMSGNFAAAANCGLISGQAPEQPFTNLAFAGPAKLKYSNDYFTESQLNTIASGGNYILVQSAGNVFSRHQLSTDMTSIEARELNITKVVDYTAKFIRNSITPFIGRSLITPSFLKIVSAILNGLGTTLIQERHLNDFKLLGVKQDEISKDTVRVSFQIMPPYPVNYIKVDLIF